jgi:glycerol uptake facilitator protein
VVYLFFYNHFLITDAPGVKKACFCTSPAIRNFKSNFFSEMVGTFVLILAVLLIQMPELQFSGADPVKVGMGSLGAMPVALVVFALGLSLGGTTGYAINPARDLGPRIAHTLLPFKAKDDNDWIYAWIPVAGPLTGAVLAALLFIVLNNL